MKSGVYVIINNQNSKLYVGSSNDTSRRFWEHKYRLKSNRHDNPHLQNSVNKYGIDSFVFFILEEVEVSDLITREQFWIDLLKPEYNMRESATGSVWDSFDDEKRAEICKKISESKMGDKNPAWKGGISKFTCPICGISYTVPRPQKTCGNCRIRPSGESHHLFGKTRSDEVKMKISQKLKGKKYPSQTKKRNVRNTGTKCNKRRVKIDGIVYPSVAEAARQLNIPYSRLEGRIRSGWYDDEIDNC